MCGQRQPDSEMGADVLTERERVCRHVLVSGSLCHARTDEEEVEVWEAEMDDGFQTILRGGGQ